MTEHPIHRREEADTPRLDSHEYGANGVGVQRELIDAVLAAWTMAGCGDPVGLLRSVNTHRMADIDNLARLAAEAVAERISFGGHSR
ncbi:hypothetical protein [Streptomyces sp. NPDC090112]|uniref:hypothetical protein n=1 Tax=Streptomyces sp. NPDC090112 TaxID=3365949 RepID=UPI0037F3B1F8